MSLRIQNFKNIRFEYEKSCDVKDLTADQFDISVPQLWYPADPSRYDRSGSARDRVSKE